MNFRPSSRTVRCFAAMLLITAAAGAGGDESAADRRARLEAMTAEEKLELQNKLSRFEELDDDERQRLRRLHGALSSHPQGQKLRGVMQRYQQWLGTLPRGTRAELLGLPAHQRIERIKQIMHGRQEQQFGGLVSHRLPRQDLKTIYDWLDDFVKKSEDELLARLPSDSEMKRRIERENDPQHRRRLLMGALRMIGSRGDLFQQEDVEELSSRLSAEAQQALTKSKDPQRLISDGIRAAVFSKVMWQVSEEDLQKFYNDRLSNEERERLEKMTREGMMWELRRLYMHERFGRPFGRPPGDRKFRPEPRGRGGPPGGRPGEPRPGARPGEPRPGGRRGQRPEPPNTT